MFIAICKQLKLLNYISLGVFILTSCALSSLRLDHFTTKKDRPNIILLYDK